MTTTPLTEEQRIVMDWIVVLAAERKRAGVPVPHLVTTAMLTAKTGRVGQVVGLVCSNLVQKGLLQRAAGGYKLTIAGVEHFEARHPKEKETPQ